jgi:hypothetical protein
MKIQDHLRQFLDDCPGTDLVAFGDLSSGLILSSTSNALVPREMLDLLGEKAADCMAFLDRHGLGAAGSPDPVGNTILHFTEDRSDAFARGSVASNDVICVVCDGRTGLEPTLRMAWALSNRIAGP